MRHFVYIHEFSMSFNYPCIFQSLLPCCHPIRELYQDQASWLLWLQWPDHQQPVQGGVLQGLEGRGWGRLQAVHHRQVPRALHPLHLPPGWQQDVRGLPGTALWLVNNTLLTLIGCLESAPAPSHLLQGVCQSLCGRASEASVHLITILSQSVSGHAVW